MGDCHKEVGGKQSPVVARIADRGCQ